MKIFSRSNAVNLSQHWFHCLTIALFDDRDRTTTKHNLICFNMLKRKQSNNVDLSGVSWATVNAPIPNTWHWTKRLYWLLFKLDIYSVFTFLLIPNSFVSFPTECKKKIIQKKIGSFQFEYHMLKTNFEPSYVSAHKLTFDSCQTVSLCMWKLYTIEFYSLFGQKSKSSSKIKTNTHQWNDGHSK